MYLGEIYPSLRRWKTALGDFLDTLAGTARETINDGYYSVEPERRISPLSLRQRILQHAGNSVISEIKPASPSLGDIRSDVDPSETACMMEAGGAAGISVLTEPTRFKGSLENLTQDRKAVTIPVLMKDFILCREQVKAAFNIGADAIKICLEHLQDFKTKINMEINEVMTKENRKIIKEPQLKKALKRIDIETEFNFDLLRLTKADMRRLLEDNENEYMIRATTQF